MSNTQLSHSILPISLTAFLLYQCWRLARRPKILHPPSPASLPFVGNLFSIPSGQEHVAFAEIGEKLKSDIIYLELLGQKIIVLNSAEAASDLLDKRSAIYSDRPSIPMVAEMNWAKTVTLAKYGELLRNYRRIMNNWLNKRAVVQFNPMQERQARLLLKRLLDISNQTQPFHAVRDQFSVGSLMLQVAYGYEPQSSDDHFFKTAQSAFEHGVQAAMQTNFLVNVFPIMLHIPAWIPGTNWKRLGREWGMLQEGAKTGLYEWVKAQIVSERIGRNYNPTIRPIAMLTPPIINQPGRTLANFLLNVIAMMVLHPHVQLRAQQELDAVLGPATLPTIADRERLPYIRNLIDEVLRMHPVVPLGVCLPATPKKCADHVLALPHVCFKDDIYRGYRIEKDTIVAISRDPRLYENPEEFNPDRYLDPDVQRPPVFGWGRRKCPGIYFAEDSAFVSAASLISMFTFSKKKNDDGEEITPQIKPKHNAVIVELDHFEFEFKPRSEDHRRLILGTDVNGDQVPST
ncbi:cytochrome P450 [Rhizoctonia solani AG-1 IA]|uniref:Cytochrome P450 n=1 Tax=Thanatephorus cucumeris (strain AG1-IA) TaxID=983506 RepID=L8WQT2_THACA|nr:cytochrome P450 [Rhizoctonia solani AG-1 IA]